jgi:hypothetical protein
MKIFSEISDDLLAGKRFEGQATEYALFFDILHKIVCQDDLTGAQNVFRLLLLAVCATFRSCSATFRRRAEIIDETNFGWCLLKIVGRLRRNVTQKYANEVGKATKSEPLNIRNVPKG